MKWFPGVRCTRRHPCSEYVATGEHPWVTHTGKCHSVKLTVEEWMGKYATEEVLRLYKRSYNASKSH